VSRKVFGVEWPRKCPSNGDQNTAPFVRMTTLLATHGVAAPE
jgi:hypothetical protein